MKRIAKLPIEGRSRNITIWITNRLRNVKGRPIKSEIQPQKRRPAPLKIEMVITSVEATPAVTFVKSTARGEATEIRAAPAVTFKARVSQSTYHLGEVRASRRSKSRVLRISRALTTGVQPGGA